MVTVVEPGAEEYPSPLLVTVIELTVPAVNVATAVAFEPAPVIVTTGGSVYPLPGRFTAIEVTGPPEPARVQTAVSLKPAVLTAVLTALFWTGSISLSSSGTSAV
jgi:hypothetical protein